MALIKTTASWIWKHRWPFSLCLLPFAYVAAITLPHPFGLGLQHGNDFQAHRIWWTDLATWYLKQGFVPLWTPSLDFGSLFFGHYGHGFFYAPGWWLHLFHAPEIPALQTWSHYLQICLHAAVALLGVFRLLRTRAGISEPAAALGASLLLINQRFHDFVRYPSAIEAMAWLPWMLLVALRLVEGHSLESGPKGRRNDFIKLSLLTALSWTAGYGQITYIGGLLTAFAACLCAREWRGLALAAGAALTGTILSAGTLVPTALMAARSPHRGGGDFSFATQNPLGTTLLEMFSHPFSADVHASAYLPPALLGLAVVGLLFAWRPGNRRLSAAMLLGGLIILDLSRGADGWLCRIAYDHLPMYSAFRIQGRNNWITLLALCWFAGLGAEAAITHGKRRRWIAAAVLLAIPGIIAIHHLTHDAPPGSLFSPASMPGLSPQDIQYSFWMLMAFSTLLLTIATMASSSMLRGIALTGTVWTFVFFFGRYTTWYRPPPSWDVHPSFPSGLLAPYRVGFGLTSHCMVDNELTREHAQVIKASGPSGRLFPATRFVFVPDAPTVPTQATLSLDNYGPNHIQATVNASSAGLLVFFNSLFPGWKGSPTPVAAPPPFERFMCFRIEAGITPLNLSFSPSWIYGCGLLTLGGLPALVACVAIARRNRVLLILVLTLALGSISFFLYGSLTRHAFTPGVLYGESGSTLDPKGMLPVLLHLDPQSGAR